MSRRSAVHHVITASGDDIMLAPGIQVYMAGAGTLSRKEKRAKTGAAPSRPVSKDDEQSRDDLLRWGDDNDFPQQVLDLYEQDPIIPRTLSNQLSMLLGGGLRVVQQTIDGDGKEVNKPIVDEAITAFFEGASTLEYLQQTGSDLLWFWNGLPELILSKDRTRIVQITGQQMAYGRFGKSGTSGKPETVYLNANWPRATAADPLSIAVPTFDRTRIDAVEALREASFYKFITPLRGPSPGRSIYALAPHDSIRTSGWLEVHLAIPQFKKFLLRNQMTIKWHIKVESGFWPVLFGKEEWGKMSMAAKVAKKREWVKSISDSLSNVEKTGVAIMTEMEQVLIGDKTVLRDYVQFMPLDGKTFSGEYIGDHMEAAANIFYALGTDPAQAGFASKDMGSRSGGSDKREAYLIALQMMKPLREQLLSPLYFSAEFNGWRAQYPGFKILFEDTILVTLDTGASTKDVAQ